MISSATLGGGSDWIESGLDVFSPWPLLPSMAGLILFRIPILVYFSLSISFATANRKISPLSYRRDSSLCLFFLEPLLHCISGSTYKSSKYHHTTMEIQTRSSRCFGYLGNVSLY